MKKLLFAFLLLLSIVSVKAQTVDETIEWLNAKVPPLCHPVYNIHTKFKSGTWQLLLSHYSGTDKQSEIFEINPYDISNISSKKFSNNNGTTILLTSKNDLFKILKCSYDNGATVSEKYVNSASFDLNTTDQAAIDKIMKALKHLATLKGARLVNDDLF